MGIVAALAGFGALLGQGRELAKTVRGDKAEEAEAQHIEHLAALSQLAAEFQQPRTTFFDDLVNAANRLPRPALALGTLGLFGYSMADPIGFAARMQGLLLVPDQLWWLLGAVVSFYFGARELHYFRKGNPNVDLETLRRVTETRSAMEGLEGHDPVQASLAGSWWPFGGRKQAGGTRATDPDANAALADWLATQR